MGYHIEVFPYWKYGIKPEKESTVLIYYTDKWGGHYTVATWTSDEEWWFPGSHEKDFEVKAWQALPCEPLNKE